MSTLWTPQGEWPVDKGAGSPGNSMPGKDSTTTGKSSGSHASDEQDSGSQDATGQGTTGRGAGSQDAQPVTNQPSTDQPSTDQPSTDQPVTKQPKNPENDETSSEEEAIARLRKELADAPVEVVLANHAAGIFELATIYMSNNPPKLPQAQLAIDALGALLGGLKGRLGEAEKTMEDALAQIRVVYVQMVNAQDEQGSQAK
ncbi:MAG: hypothetical protein M1456_00880 [Actinobacteria bacterium]|nr:hypothetical protein [Actinomycetota bacterium]